MTLTFTFPMTKFTKEGKDEFLLLVFDAIVSSFDHAFDICNALVF